MAFGGLLVHTARRESGQRGLMCARGTQFVSRNACNSRPTARRNAAITCLPSDLKLMWFVCDTCADVNVSVSSEQTANQGHDKSFLGHRCPSYSSGFRVVV